MLEIKHPFWREAEAHYALALRKSPKRICTLENTPMKILRAIGLAVAIIVLKLLMPNVFEGLEATLITFFGTLRETLTLGSESLQSGATSAIPVPRIPGY
jgi:hypothetical protein